MKYLTESYRPIEVYLIVNKSKVEFIDMLLLLLIELLSKKILTIEYIKIRNNEHAGNIKIGENYKSYKHKPIDQLFLHPFIQNSTSTFNFQYILLKAIEKAGSRNHCIRLIAKSSQIKRLLKRKFLLSIFGVVKLNKDGKELANKIEEEIANISQRVSLLMSNYESNTTEIINLLCNRIYFINRHYNQKANYLNHLNLSNIIPTVNCDLKHELRIYYFKKRLQLAHVELLKMDHNLKVYEIERNGEAMD